MSLQRWYTIDRNGHEKPYLNYGAVEEDGGDILESQRAKSVRSKSRTQEISTIMRISLRIRTHLLIERNLVVLMLALGAVLAQFISPGMAFAVSLEEIVENIRVHENAISIAEADFKVTMKNGLPYWEGTWGREGSKGYLRGRQWVRWEDGSRTSYQEIYAFDGERLRTFQPDPERMGGTIRELYTELDSRPTPQTLLGYSILAYGRHTLADVLENSEDLKLAATQELIDGSTCYLVECIVRTSTSEPGFTVPDLVKVWVDPERNYRPLRIEKYRDALGESLMYVIDKIHLTTVDGMWLPASGVLRWYERVPVPLHGYTLEEVMALPDSEQLKHVRFETRLEKEPWSAKRIEVSNWRILDDIDDAKFTISFPAGSRIWDDFAKKGIVIGQDEEE